MDVKILDVISGNEIDAVISRASLKDMPLKKNGWQFSWRTLYKAEAVQIFKLSIKSSSVVEGLFMFSVMNGEMVYMNNIEIASHNLGTEGKYDRVAGCLIAFGCLKSFELGRNNYEGYLTFESKTKLISLYQDRYGATLAIGQRMFIDPNAGLHLMEKFLKL